jgi:hypothetical protein
MLDVINQAYFSHGRTALKYGLNSINLVKKSKILVPDYICEIVNIAIKHSGYEVVSYPLKDNLQPNWKILNKINLKGVSAILMVHYFGFPQNISIFKKFCKKNKLYLIEDNAHGFSGTVKKKLLGTFGDVGFSSIRKNINIPYGGILYSQNINVKNISKKIRINYPYFCIQEFLYRFPYIKIMIKKFILNRKKFEDPFSFRDTKLYNNSIDNLSYDILKKIKIKEEKKKKIINYKIWISFLKKKKIHPIFKTPDNNLMIWCLPFYTKSKEDSKKWFDWGHKNGITIFSWPQIDIKYLKEKKELLKRWERLVCLPLNIPEEYLKKICK